MGNLISDDKDLLLFVMTLRLPSPNQNHCIITALPGHGHDTLLVTDRAYTLAFASSSVSLATALFFLSGLYKLEQTISYIYQQWNVRVSISSMVQDSYTSVTKWYCLHSRMPCACGIPLGHPCLLVPRYVVPSQLPSLSPGCCFN